PRRHAGPPREPGAHPGDAGRARDRPRRRAAGAAGGAERAARPAAAARPGPGAHRVRERDLHPGAVGAVNEPGRREQNRLEVQGRLVEAALALFGASGFDAVSIEAITDRAGVSRRTFFRYFPTKEDVVLAR